MRSRSTTFSALTVAAAIAAGALPSAAQAVAYVPTGAECTLSVAPGPLAGPALEDPLGYVFDVTTNLTPLGQDRPSQYATIENAAARSAIDGGGNLGRDAFDNWGDLYVGDAERAATQYLDDDRLGCERELGSPLAGRQVAFTPITIGALTVQRKLLVSSSASVGGARLLQTVSNPTGAPITTSVFVGDLTADLKKGSLGSDSATVVGPTSSGDGVIDPADDRWAVTSDGGKGGDPAIAHVWGGPSAATPATIARSGAQAGTKPVTGSGTLDTDMFGYGWQNVTVPAGGSATFLSWEVLRSAADNDVQVAQAKAAATALQAAPASTIFEGLSAGEIATVRNWASPAPSVGIAPVAAVARPGEAVSLHSAGVELSGGLSICGDGRLDWDFGDGTAASGSSADHVYDAGRYTVTLTAVNACGGRTVRSTSIDVVAPNVPGTPAPVVTPAPKSVPAPAPGVSSRALSTETRGSATRESNASTTAATAGAKLSVTAPARISLGELKKGGLMTAVVSSASGSLRVVLTGPGLKLVKTLELAAGDPRTPTFKLRAKEAAKLRKASTVQVAATLTLANGSELVQTKTVVLKR